MVSQHTATEVRCHVLTFKEGLLSSIAHDLKIQVERCSLEYTTAQPTDSADRADLVSIVATFDPRSLRVVCARHDGSDAPGVLSKQQCAEIEKHIQEDVLHSDRFPQIRFVSSQVGRAVGGGYDVTGELLLHGQKQTLRGSARSQANRLLCQVPLRQTDFGIKPYSAMLGALRIKPEILIELSAAWLV